MHNDDSNIQKQDHHLLVIHGGSSGHVVACMVCGCQSVPNGAQCQCDHMAHARIGIPALPSSRVRTFRWSSRGNLPRCVLHSPDLLGLRSSHQLFVGRSNILCHQRNREDERQPTTNCTLAKLARQFCRVNFTLCRQASRIGKERILIALGGHVACAGAWSVKMLLIRTCVHERPPPVHDRPTIWRVTVKQSHRARFREPSDFLVFPASSARLAQATCPADVVDESFEASVMRTCKQSRPAWPQEGPMPALQSFPRLALPHQLDQDRTKQHGLHNHNLHAIQKGRAFLNA